MPRRPLNSIPAEHRMAVYYLGLIPEEIVSVRTISQVPMVFDVHLRKGEREWHGHIPAPEFSMRPPVTRMDDLIDSTQTCPACGGSGKVPRTRT